MSSALNFSGVEPLTVSASWMPMSTTGQASRSVRIARTPPRGGVLYFSEAAGPGQNGIDGVKGDGLETHAGNRGGSFPPRGGCHRCRGAPTCSRVGGAAAHRDGVLSIRQSPG